MPPAVQTQEPGLGSPAYIKKVSTAPCISNPHGGGSRDCQQIPTTQWSANLAKHESPGLKVRDLVSKVRAHPSRKTRGTDFLTRVQTCRGTHVPLSPITGKADVREPQIQGQPQASQTARDDSSKWEFFLPHMGLPDKGKICLQPLQHCEPSVFIYVHVFTCTINFSIRQHPSIQLQNLPANDCVVF